jgi:hypothetical protein
MSEDESELNRKRNSASNNINNLIENTTVNDGSGAIVPVDKSKVRNIVNQFEPGAPPSANLTRDTKRMKIVRKYISKGSNIKTNLAGDTSILQYYFIS